ncbi:MAG: beta-ribofuranosylaminobenzene 5'-phosphate synthase [Candidatus Helarchaeota archaeon]
MKKIKIKTISRLHFGLIDLNGSLGRIDGGIGLALNYPNTILEAIPEKKDIIIETESQEETIREIIDKVMKNLAIDKGIKIIVKELIPPHVGLGSKTQLSLAIASLITRFYIDKVPSLEELGRITNRGGTSGIGINIFDKGGFILDAGHSFGPKKEKESILPSSASVAPPALPLARFEVPPEWYFVITIPNAGKHIHGINEVNIFQRFCPIPEEEVGKVARLVLMKILPSIALKSIESFGEGLTKLQQIGFKKLEVDLQPELIKDLMKFYLDNGAYGTGISSFGSVTYGLVHGSGNAKRLKKKVEDFLKNREGGTVFTTNSNNTGFSIYEFS